VRIAPSFLTTQAPLADAELLVVEGWMPGYAIDAAAAEFKRGAYHRLITCGSITGDGWNQTPPYTFADRAADLLKPHGLGERVVAVPCFVERKDRTYHSALAVRAALAARGEMPAAINVVTLGPHARRSRLLFEKAFSGETRIGVIAIDDRGYEPTRWWQSSEGTREIIGETIAYLYVRLLFWPGEPKLESSPAVDG